jgi:hypothetical protein
MEIEIIPFILKSSVLAIFFWIFYFWGCYTCAKANSRKYKLTVRQEYDSYNKVHDYIEDELEAKLKKNQNAVDFLIDSHKRIRHDVIALRKENMHLKLLMDFPGCTGCPTKGKRDGT